MDCSPPGSSVHGILQGRTLEWVAVPSSRDLPNPGIKPGSLTSPALADGFFNTSTTWEAWARPDNIGVIEIIVIWMKMKWISIYLSTYLSSMERWTNRHSEDRMIMSTPSSHSVKEDFRGVSLIKYLILKHRETERERMPVHREENVEIKTWTWQVWGRKEDNENFSCLHHRTLWRALKWQ